MLVRGDRLPVTLRDEVLRAYGYRWTVENETRARHWYHNSGLPTLQPVTDREWLASKAFYVTKAGQLHRGRRHCEPAYLADYPA